MQNYQFYVPTKVLFGAGKLNELGRQKMPGSKALLVISNGKSTQTNGSLKRTSEQLKQAGVDFVIFDKIEANPLKSTVMAGAAVARANACDFIVALGGGSVMDAAKAIATMATNSGDAWDYMNGGTGGGKPIVADPLALICITTTAGTGSEVDEWGVVTNEVTHEKMGFGGDERLFPVLAIVDPELMLTVPPKFTAYQGFDALFHATEVYISNYANPMSDMLALCAIEHLGKYLVQAVKNGSDLEARGHVAFANTISGYAMVAGCTTSEHSLEHAMSAYHQDLPHGAGLIMISKAYYEHFVDANACDERFIRMAQALGVTNAKEPMDFVRALVKLQEDCQVHDLKMSDYAIEPTEFVTLAKNAMETMAALFTADPCQLSVEDCVQIYTKSYR